MTLLNAWIIPSSADIEHFRSKLVLLILFIYGSFIRYFSFYKDLLRIRKYSYFSL